MTDNKAVMQQALNWLYAHPGNYNLNTKQCALHDSVIHALSAAIAQPVQPEQERLREALEQIANESVRNLGSARIVARHALAQVTQTEQIAKPFAWCIESTNSADWSFSATEEGVKSNALLMDADCIKNAPFPLYKLPAIAQPEQPAVPATVAQYSRCSDTLRNLGKVYPRTCAECGLGPCKTKPAQQKDKP